MTEPQEARNAADIAVLGDQLARVRARIDELALAVSGVQGTIEDQRDVLRSVDGLRETVDLLVQRFNALFPPDDPDARRTRGPSEHAEHEHDASDERYLHGTE